MALAERTWERVGERKRDRARLIESTDTSISELNSRCYELRTLDTNKIHLMTRHTKVFITTFYNDR